MKNQRLEVPRLEYLDAARGIAVVGVICVHVVSHFPTGLPTFDFVFQLGRYGVQLFYTLSACSLCVTFGLRHTREKNPIRKFFVRRLCRLAPPFWVAMAIALSFLHWDFDGFRAQTSDSTAIVLSALMVEGFWPTPKFDIVPGGGSVMAEIVFYVLFPLLYVYGRSLGILALIGLAVIIIDYVLARPLYETGFIWAGEYYTRSQLKSIFYFSALNQLPVFLSGLMFYRWRMSKWRPQGRFEWFCIISFVFGFGISSVPLVGVTSLCLVCLSLLSTREGAALRVFARVGRCSYSMFLFHFALVNLLVHLDRNGPLGNWSVGIMKFLVCLLVVLIASWVVGLVTKPILEDFGTALGRRLTE